MKYSKPKIIAQNKSAGSFAAACPSSFYGGTCDATHKCDKAK